MEVARDDRPLATDCDMSCVRLDTRALVSLASPGPQSVL